MTKLDKNVFFFIDISFFFFTFHFISGSQKKIFFRLNLSTKKNIFYKEMYVIKFLPKYKKRNVGRYVSSLAERFD